MGEFEVIENEADEFCMVQQVGPICISVEYVGASQVERLDGTMREVPAGYLATLTTDEWGDPPPSKGWPMATKEAAAEAAHALVPLHLRAMARSFGVVILGEILDVAQTYAEAEFRHARMRRGAA